MHVPQPRRRRHSRAVSAIMTMFLVVLAAALLSIAKEQRASERVTEKWILGAGLPQPQRQRRPTRTTTATHAHKQRQTTSMRGGTFGGFPVGSSGGLNVGPGSSTILGSGKATTLTRPNRHVLRANKRREYVGPTGRYAYCACVPAHVCDFVCVCVVRV